MRLDFFIHTWIIPFADKDLLTLYFNLTITRNFLPNVQNSVFLANIELLFHIRHPNRINCLANSYQNYSTLKDMKFFDRFLYK